MKEKIIILILSILILGVIFGIVFFNTITGNTVSEIGNTTTLQEYSLEEIAKHNTAEDCLLSINGNVYNISTFISLGIHNSKIINGCGKDATEQFSKHPESAKNKIEQYKIGVLI